MAALPPLLPERGKFAQLFSWLNRLRACVIELQPRNSLNTLTTSGPGGVFRKSNPAVKEEGSGGDPVWL